MVFFLIFGVVCNVEEENKFCVEGILVIECNFGILCFEGFCKECKLMIIVYNMAGEELWLQELELEQGLEGLLSC